MFRLVPTGFIEMFGVNLNFSGHGLGHRDVPRGCWMRILRNFQEDPSRNSLDDLSGGLQSSRIPFRPFLPLKNRFSPVISPETDFEYNHWPSSEPPVALCHLQGFQAAYGVFWCLMSLFIDALVSKFPAIRSFTLFWHFRRYIRHDTRATCRLRWSHVQSLRLGCRLFRPFDFLRLLENLYFFSLIIRDFWN